MGQVGRYIDSRPDEGKDRIIEAREWSEEFWVNLRNRDCRCLVGHAEDMQRNSDELQHSTRLLGYRVAAMFSRFGIPRISRIFKLRAAKNNVVAIPAEIPAAL